jgi:hypothetical protein
MLQEIPYFHTTLSFMNVFRQTRHLTLSPILSQFNPIHTFTPSFLFVITLPLHITSQNRPPFTFIIRQKDLFSSGATEWRYCRENRYYTHISLFRLNQTLSIWPLPEMLVCFKCNAMTFRFRKLFGELTAFVAVHCGCSPYRETKICTIEGKEFLFWCYSVCTERLSFMRGWVAEDLA